MFTVDMGDLGRFSARVKRLTIFADDRNPVLLAAVRELLKSWERRLEEGNRKGVLAGLDKDGKPAPKLRYRPKGGVRKLTLAQRLGQRPNLRRGKYAGTGKHPGVLPNNNLTTTEYRHLAGPRDAPRGQFSRVITNAETGQGKDPNRRFVWFATLAWRGIASAKGYRFLKDLCQGTRTIPPYDIRGVRPDDRKLMRQDLVNWVKLLIRGHYSG